MLSVAKLPMAAVPSFFSFFLLLHIASTVLASYLVATGMKQENILLWMQPRNMQMLKLPTRTTHNTFQIFAFFFFNLRLKL